MVENSKQGTIERTCIVGLGLAELHAAQSARSWMRERYSLLHPLPREQQLTLLTGLLA